jgi:hypothetical protein
MTRIPTLPVFEVEWKGQSLGSFTLVNLRERLASGQLSRMHRVKVDGAWLPLGVWLDQMEASGQQANAIAEAQRQRELSAERERAAALAQQLHQQEQQLRHTAPARFGESHAAPSPVSLPSDTETNLPYTSGFAVAALVFGILAALFLVTLFVLASEQNLRWVGFVTWCGTIAWLLATILGHVAIIEIRRDPLARGQGLAFTGLMLGYTVIALITFLVFLASLRNDYRHLLN